MGGVVGPVITIALDGWISCDDVGIWQRLFGDNGVKGRWGSGVGLRT